MIVVAVGLTGVITIAVALAIVDLYITGHGGASLSRPWMSWSFVDLSRADVILLAGTLLSSGLAAFLSGRVSRA